ncbi:hypothetical protein [Candidatus Odyssella thessalonicensis]|uniref:hypothetical protein n=1 Tax=Candidatus Odyssella thessalonicensis TaxID=84647 RepID=UPI000225C0AF|nr:hypothetical protein [Candidatus Odyssella thessalonicensis]
MIIIKLWLRLFIAPFSLTLLEAADQPSSEPSKPFQFCLHLGSAEVIQNNITHALKTKTCTIDIMQADAFKQSSCIDLNLPVFFEHTQLHQALALQNTNLVRIGAEVKGALESYFRLTLSQLDPKEPGKIEQHLAKHKHLNCLKPLMEEAIAKSKE